MTSAECLVRMLAAVVKCERDEREIAAALGIDLVPERPPANAAHFNGEFASGPFVSAHYFRNRDTGLAYLSLAPRPAAGLSVRDIDCRRLSPLQPQFNGFDLNIPDRPELYIIELGDKTVHFQETLGLRSVVVEWAKL